MILYFDKWILSLYHHLQKFKKMKRSSYIAILSKNCLNVNSQDQDVVFFGWRMRDDHYNIHWFGGDPAPNIGDVVR